MEYENKYLSLKDLENIKCHTYKTTGYSKLDNLMNPFWIWCADLLPHWLSANWVTVLGVISQLLGIVLISFFDFSMKKEIPYIIYIFFSVFVFLGQTFDAIDGKHARKTNRSSPLGQLMDHGCDAFSNSFIAIMISQAYLFGGSLNAVLLQSCIQLRFFCAQWEENHTKIIKTHINDIGVTEYQFLTMGLLIIPYFAGHFLADKSVLWGYASIADIIMFINAVFAVISSIEIIYHNLKDLTKDQIFDRIYPLYSLIILIIAEFIGLKLKLFENNSLLVVLLNGFFFGFQTNKLILCTMTNKKIELISIDNFLYFFCVILALLFNSIQAEMLLLTVAFAIIAYRYYEFLSLTTVSLLRFLKIDF